MMIDDVLMICARLEMNGKSRHSLTKVIKAGLSSIFSFTIVKGESFMKATRTVKHQLPVKKPVAVII